MLLGETLITMATLIYSLATLPIKIVEAISLSLYGCGTPEKKGTSSSRIKDREVFFIRNLIQAPRQQIMIMTETLISSSLPYTESRLSGARTILFSFVTKENSNSRMLMQQLNSKA